MSFEKLSNNQPKTNGLRKAVSERQPQNVSFKEPRFEELEIIVSYGIGFFNLEIVVKIALNILS